MSEKRIFDEAEVEKLCAEIEHLTAENEKLRTPLGRDIELLEDNARLEAELKLANAVVEDLRTVLQKVAPQALEIYDNGGALAVLKDED